MKLLALGTCCVDVYPQKQRVTPGGEALNVAIQLSERDDVDVYLMGLIGKDDYAQAIIKSLDGRKIDTTHLYQVDGSTAHHVIHINHEGDRYFTEGAWHGGVSANLTFNTDDKALFIDIDAVMVTLWEPNLQSLLQYKVENNFLIAVDFNDQRDFSKWEPLIDDIDIFFSSAHEDMKPIFFERSKRSRTLFVLTFGEHGSVAYHKGQVFECAAEKVAEVIDTTGCGDCYQAHFVAEFLKTKDIQKAMKRATLEASKVTQYVGGFPNQKN